jgi:hypothetical protein
MVQIKAYWKNKKVNKYFACQIDAQEYREWLDARYATVVWINH